MRESRRVLIQEKGAGLYVEKNPIFFFFFFSINLNLWDSHGLVLVFTFKVTYSRDKNLPNPDESFFFSVFGVPLVFFLFVEGFSRGWGMRALSYSFIGYGDREVRARHAAGTVQG